MKRYKKYFMVVPAAVVLALLCICPSVFSHCEIPCGIYDDPMRINMMAEDIKTIEKSMNEINALSEAGDKNYNQLVRWIMNKENHSYHLSEIVTQYFMKQRITPVESSEGQTYREYVNKLTLLHKLMVYSMKCKQTTDLDNVKKLREYLGQFETAYMGEAGTASGHSTESGHEH